MKNLNLINKFKSSIKKIEKEKAMKEFLKQKEAEQAELENLYRKTEEEEK